MFERDDCKTKTSYKMTRNSQPGARLPVSDEDGIGREYGSRKKIDWFIEFARRPMQVWLSTYQNDRFSRSMCW